MKKLYVLKGLPASGKSTWAKEKAKEEPNTVIVNRDKIREMLKGEYKNFPFGTSMEDLVTEIEHFTFQEALSKGYNVIMDATNFRWNLGKTYIKLTYNAELEIVSFLDVPLEECIRRDSLREISVGKEVIERMYNKYLK